MANLTITVSADVLRKARIRALEQGVSVNQVLGEYLRNYAGAGTISEAVERALAVADRTTSGSGPDGRRWKRDEVYDRHAR
ncbi:MAG: hypothetical protein JW797_08985 [Bradymonadales bacterium]|nr:hypothetical protein [Bradymonadales bacterium]